MRDLCLIVSIVRRGWGDTVLNLTIKNGAHGGTVLFGRGVGRSEQSKFFGIQIEPEKEVVLTIVPVGLKATLLEEIRKTLDLDAPAQGLAFVLPIESIIGAEHITD
jgi:nitrogen regulatory protein P-II 1